ncbi:c-type cytochrome [Weeksellaceae bacterium TAE3-ERU29]|nr:c-type cytochrome [Weeksellaceae bacterium TAE3-ERU29]
MRISFFVFIFLLLSCNEAFEEPISKSSVIEFKIPSNFPKTTYDFEGTPLDKNVIALGKDLFFDGILSSDGTISCASCHHQSFAFADRGNRFSTGVRNQLGERNTPPIQNVAFMKTFTWDGAIQHIDVFPIVPIKNEVEMDETLRNVLKKLQNNKNYQHKFSQAFKNQKIDIANTFTALAQFMITMVSANSKYDKYIRKEGVEFTTEEKKGKAIFDKKCASCHSGALFTNETFQNTGLLPDPQKNDIGYGRVSGYHPEDDYKFRVPSLRNVEVTAPYMHDGRFATLKEVLDFYDKDVQDVPFLAKEFRNGNRVGISLSEEEKQAIITFLKTLTDYDFLNNRNFKP